MARKILQFALVFTAGLLALPAERNPQGSSAQNRPTSLSGITVSAIPGSPFSATVVIESRRYWSEDYTEVRRSINLIARDSKGRTHNEQRRLMPESFHGSPQLYAVRIFDPETRTLTVYDPVGHLARRLVLPKEATTAGTLNPAIRSEDLGTSTMSGVAVKGTRRTLSFSRKESGVGESVQIEDEEWYSGEMQLMFLAHHVDPRYGEQTVGISSLKREEPPASMFQVPEGYRILDVTPPAPASGKTPPEAKP
jgi:hypothetical protein